MFLVINITLALDKIGGGEGVTNCVNCLQGFTEIYKSTNHLSPSLVWEFHEKKHVEYNLRTKNFCKLPTIRSESFGLQSLSFRGSFLWNTVDDSIKNEPTLLAFKNKIKNWSGKNTPAGFATNLTL